ncbi:MULTISPECIES: hypothetical protein [Subtercola]|uniref:HIRAN domain-containing protein n=1 Tax=Subtercola vilae TaxID=2056433 RepID=A0A4T2C595_9MICO|nr:MULTISPECIES: hypothetical protein [Subtercola]MEA9984075.1 hypothetical protein [Subtercola sp. RTI3]TIH38702.1 hypothetical protein D4765_06310 [Subtercola vilae]
MTALTPSSSSEPAATPEPLSYSKKDSGTGKLTDYRYDMLPKNAKVTLQLAASDPCQQTIAEVQAKNVSDLQAFVARRTLDEERTDAPVAVRLFVDSRMTGLVGYVPRGLEAPVLDTLTRLENAGRTARIPAEIVKTRNGLRINLLLGQTR